MYGNYNDYYTDGRIDQVRIFNKAISAEEVTKLYTEIQCANTIATPESYFNTVTYSNPSTSQAYAVGFAPDFVWFKERTGTSSHQLYDTIRTDHEALFSNNTDGEYDYSNHPSGDLAPTITSTGFTTPSVVNAGINTSNDSYVAWAWKAASSNTTNNDGTIASTVRASQESGFSIVKVTFNTSSPQRIGHGLASAPEFIISKRTSTTSDWNCYHKFVDSTSPEDYLITFSIDGLEDTNHIYRINAKWESIMEAIETVHENKINTTWKFIVFKHNQHQIKDAEQFSRKLGFKNFKLIKSDRWWHRQDLMPTEEFVDSSYKHQAQVTKGTDDKSSTIRQRCMSVLNGEPDTELYIDSDGDFYPCCKTGLYAFRYKNIFSPKDRKFNIRDNTVEQILNHPDVKGFFDSTKSYDTAFSCCKIYCRKKEENLV